MLDVGRHRIDVLEDVFVGYRGIVIIEMPGQAGDFASLVPCSLEIGHHLAHGDDFPQILGHRLAAGDEVDDLFVYLHIQVVQDPVPADDLRRRMGILVLEGLHGAAQLIQRQFPHGVDQGGDLVELVIEALHGVVAVVWHASPLSRSGRLYSPR